MNRYALARNHYGMAFGVLATVNGVGDFLASSMVGPLWTAAGTTVAFGHSAVLFAAGALLVSRIHSPTPGTQDKLLLLYAT